jgi:hypothetical protein
MNYLVSIISIFFLSCQVKQKDDVYIQKEKYIPSSPPAYKSIVVNWLNNPIIKLKIQSKLDYRQSNIKCDSVLAIEYTGFEEGTIFFPINNHSQIISTVIKVVKIDTTKINTFTKLLGDSESYKNNLLISCYEPRFALVYYNKDTIIAQTIICLECARLSSTINIPSPKQSGLINKKARNQLGLLISSIFSFNKLY